MIPYSELREIPIGGGRSLAAFGTFVALGIFVGAWFVERRARRMGIPQRTLVTEGRRAGRRAGDGQ